MHGLWKWLFSYNLVIVRDKENEYGKNIVKSLASILRIIGGYQIRLFTTHTSCIEQTMSCTTFSTLKFRITMKNLQFACKTLDPANNILQITIANRMYKQCYIVRKYIIIIIAIQDVKSKNIKHDIAYEIHSLHITLFAQYTICAVSMRHCEHLPGTSFGTLGFMGTFKIPHKCSHTMGWTINPFILQTLISSSAKILYIRIFIQVARAVL